MVIKYKFVILTIWANLMGMLFMYMSSLWKSFCELNQVDMYNIFSCVKGEILSPFVYIFFSLGILFFLLSWFEIE